MQISVRVLYIYINWAIIMKVENSLFKLIPEEILSPSSMLASGFSCFFLKICDCCFCWKGRVTRRNREVIRAIIHLLIHAPKYVAESHTHGSGLTQYATNLSTYVGHSL